MLDTIDLDRWPDDGTRAVVRDLLNHVETLHTALCEAQEEIRRLRAENARLKGEQGPPTIRPQASGPQSSRDVSS